ncbi:hypothetical protein [Acidicapsa ligni]|uniref:hypothetical protein n=1 Tax=Acidicapsa ligni TaxID=542300 RepID=UPI0021E02045|nr:hypothetical protein [Acidicapsa ligni]
MEDRSTTPEIVHCEGVAEDAQGATGRGKALIRAKLFHRAEDIPERPHHFGAIREEESFRFSVGVLEVAKQSPW